MKRRTLLTLAALTAGSWLTPAAHAELNPALVPADAKWVVYADLAALRESTLGQQIIDRLPIAESMAEASPLQPNIGKILDAVGSITGFGNLQLSTDNADMTGALIIEGTTDLRKIAEGLVAHATVSAPDQFVEVEGLPIETYRMENEIFIGFPSEPIVLVSRSQDMLLQSLDLYRGKGASLAAGRHALTSLLPAQGKYYLYAASQVPSEAIGGGENTPQARVLQMTQAASVVLGEQGENLIASATLESKDNALAEKLVRILNGLTAMLSLAESSDADLMAFIQSVSIRRDDRRVAVQMAYPTERLAAMLQEQMHNMEEHAQQAEAARSEAPVDDTRAHIGNVDGEAIADWHADADLGSDAISAENFALFTSEPVALSAGSIVVLSSIAHNGEHARVDYIDLIPATGGESTRYEAEFMRLANYRIEESEHASGGELISSHGGPAKAQLRFHGPAGSYRLRVRYVDETDGVSAFALSHLAPAN